MRRRPSVLLPALVVLAACATAGRTAAPEAAPAAAGAPSVADAAQPVVLRWRAASEERVFGYLVYRASERQGPYVRVSEEIVQVPEDGAADHAYEFVDADVVPGATYHYYLDVVDTTGRKERFSGVVSRTVQSAARPAGGVAPTP